MKLTPASLKTPRRKGLKGGFFSFLLCVFASLREPSCIR